MGRHGGRSKGCRICRQRRIKCDEIQPECGQCLRTGRACPGAATGNVFINLSASADAKSESSIPAAPRLVVPSQSRKKASSEPALSDRLVRRPSRVSLEKEDETESTEAGSSHPHVSHATDAAVISLALRDIGRMELPLWYQPSKADLFQQHFTSHFICNFFNPAAFVPRQNMWAYHLPAVLTSTPSPAVEHATRAATMAFYGTKAADESIKTEACRWYVKGMGIQRIELEKAASPERARQLDVTSVLAPLMFSIFESIMMTNQSGWVQHLHAACKFLEMFGPEACQDGLAYGLLRSVRLGVVFCAFSWTTPPIIASKEWCTIPFAIHGKNAYDLLDDIFMQIPECVMLRTRYKGLVATGIHGEAKLLVPEAEAKAKGLLEQLDNWWIEHAHELGEPWAGSSLKSQLAPNDQTSSPGPTANFIVPKTFNSTFTASTIAKFSTTSVIAFGVLRLMYKKSGFSKEITNHGNSILAAFQHQERAGVAHTGSLTMLHPLIVLCYQAVTRRQREAAKSAIVAWGKPRGMGKFVESSISLPDRYDGQD